MASRYLSNTILTARPQRPRLPSMSRLSRATARTAIIIMTLVGALLFLYLAQASQGALTEFDIAMLQGEYEQLLLVNQELERQIAEAESPHRILDFATANGMVPRTDVSYITILPESGN